MSKAARTSSSASTAAASSSSSKSPSPHAGPALSDCTPGLCITQPLADLCKSVPRRPAGSLKFISFNVNGLRATFQAGDRRAGMLSWLAAEQPDVLALQETKCTEAEALALGRDGCWPGYDAVFYESNAKKGYSGTAFLVRTASSLKPLSVQRGLGVHALDQEGRVLTLEFENLYLVNCYTPNSGQNLENLTWRTTTWDPHFAHFLNRLRGSSAPALPAPSPRGGGGAGAPAIGLAAFGIKSSNGGGGGGGGASSHRAGGGLPPLSATPAPKPVMLLGDLNVCHQDLDVHKPQAYRNKVAGFCDAERDNFAALLLARGWTDVFREAHPRLRQYTYFGTRGNSDRRLNEGGWRLDYVLVAAALGGERQAGEGAAAGGAGGGGGGGSSSSSSSSSSAAAAGAGAAAPASACPLSPQRVLVEVRGTWPGPSDHLPVVATWTPPEASE